MTDPQQYAEYVAGTRVRISPFPYEIAACVEARTGVVVEDAEAKAWGYVAVQIDGDGVYVFAPSAVQLIDGTVGDG